MHNKNQQKSNSDPARGSAASEGSAPDKTGRMRRIRRTWGMVYTAVLLAYITFTLLDAFVIPQDIVSADAVVSEHVSSSLFPVVFARRHNICLILLHSVRFHSIRKRIKAQG